MAEIIEKAKTLYKKKKYGAVIQLLEPRIFEYREHVLFYRLLGYSCLQVGDYGGANTYLLRGHNLRPEDPDIRHCIALLYLRKGDITTALQHWLDILDDFPEHRLSKRAMNIVKGFKTDDDFDNFILSSRFKSLFPSLKFSSKKWPVIVVVFLLCVAGAGTFYYYQTNAYASLPPEAAKALIAVERTDSNILRTEGEFKYLLTEGEVDTLKQTIKVSMLEYNDNMARYAINKLLLSNISDTLKKSINGLKRFLKTPEFGRLKTNFEYEKIVKEPWLYDGVFIQWKGRISNLRIEDNVIRFDFLVGYHTKKVLKGIVPVIIDFPISLDPERAYELLAQVVYDSGHATGFYLDCVSIRWLGE
ncbi:hypothetical protein WKV44_04110 [Spirochaetia bacterium 38H-sp]|uniref:Tetratricopeptide repeat protein n=1 Tax=Rarispira pelagica TaxID=3141764 RepID=A0ABU9UAN1_9SPIR